MLPKKNRLTKAEVVRVLRNGKIVFQNPLFTALRYFPIQPQQKEKKIAVVIGKKIARFAVERNKIRRSIYQAFQHCFAQKPFHSWVVFIVKKRIVSKSDKEIVDEMDKMANRLGLKKT